MTKPKKPRNIIIEWPELKKSFTDAIENGTRFSDGQYNTNAKIEKWHIRPLDTDEWEGGSAAMTMKYIRNGYRTDAFTHSAEYAAMSNKRHFTYNEDDGEIDLDRVFDGHDAIFLDREMRESRPGLRLMIEYGFSWTTSVEIIVQYGAWVASLIKSLESSGYDLVVDIYIPLDAVFQNDGRGQRTNTFIRVKQENEQSNFTDWSVLFAPTGFRQLGFYALTMAAERNDRFVSSTYGQTISGKDWGVDYNRESQTVTVSVNQRSGTEYLPVDKLNDEAIEQKLLPAPIKVEKMMLEYEGGRAQ